MSKRNMILAGVGALLALVTLASNAKANADTSDDVFLLTLAREHVADQYSNDELTGLGRQVCKEIAQGYDVKIIGKSIADVYNIKYWDAMFLVGDAVGSYCAEYHGVIDGRPNTNV